MSEEMAEPTLLGLGTWTRQGPATLVVRENAWMVLVPGLRKQVTEAAWDVLGGGPAAEELLEQLVEAGELGSADKLTALLFGIHDGDRATLGVKGSTPLAVYTAEGSQQLVGTEEEPVVLRSFEQLRRVAFGDLPPEEPIGAPRIVSGIVPVRGFVRMSVDPAQLEEDERAALAEQVEKDGRSIETEEAKKRRAERSARKPASTPTSSSSTSSSSAPRKPAVATRKPGEMPPSLSGGGSRSTSRPTPSEEPSGPNLFAGLFGDAPAPVQTPGPAEAPAPAEPTGTAEAAAPVAAPATGIAASEPAETGDAAAVVTPAAAAASAGPEQAQEAAPPPASEQDRAPATSPAVPAPARQAGQEAEPSRPAPAKRRLVSTSLFDRRRAAAAPPPEPSPATEAAAPATEPAPAAAGADALQSPPTLVAPIDDGALAAPTPAPQAPSPSQPSSRPSGAASGDLENTGAYDDLFGKTVFRRIEDAAVRRTGEEDDPEHAAQPAARGEAGAEDASPEGAGFPAETRIPSASSADEEEPVAEHTTDAGDFIDWVPGVGRTAPEIAQAAARRAARPQPAPPAYPQVHMAERPPAPATGPRPAPPGHAAPRSHAAPPHHAAQPGHAAPRSPYRQQPSPAPRSPHGGPAAPKRPAARPTGGAVALPGLVCANGHANPPDRPVCRLCAAPLGGPTRTVARPSLGVIALSTGEGFVLDRGTIVGRRPRASRVSGADVPQLITVPSPQQDISRSHLELRLEGWHVVALDLGTTNGTTLHRTGHEPLRLRPREGTLLHDGDLLDLGDGVHLTYRERS